MSLWRVLLSLVTLSSAPRPTPKSRLVLPLRDRSEVLQRVKELTREVLLENQYIQSELLDVSKMTEETDLIDNLGADSLDLVNLVIEYEDEFGINIEDREANSLRTIGDFTNYIYEMYKAAVGIPASV